MKTNPQYPIGTIVVFPDKREINFRWITGYGNRETTSPKSRFPIPTNEIWVTSGPGGGGGTYTYTAPTVAYAQQVEKLLDSIPENPWRNYTRTVITDTLPLPNPHAGFTVIILPDGVNLNMSSVSSYLIDPDPSAPGPDWLTFRLTDGSKLFFHAASVTAAQLILLALAAIIRLPGGTYIVNQYIPTFAVLSLSPETGTAAGGTAITVNGVGFISGCVANLGGTVVPTGFASPTQLTIISAAHTVGTGTGPVITNPDGSKSVTGTHYTWT